MANEFPSGWSGARSTRPPHVPRQPAPPAAHPGARPPVPDGARPEFAERLARQLAGIDAWTASRQVRAHTIRRSAASREQRLDALRRLECLDRTHDAVVDAVARELASAPAPLSVPVRTAVVAHGQPWYARTLADNLARVGVDVLLCTDDAAEALGVVVAEQPDALVCGDRLKRMTGCLLLAEAALFAPHTVLVAQVDDGAEQMALGAGAAVTVLRREPPVDVVAALVGLLAEHP